MSTAINVADLKVGDHLVSIGNVRVPSGPVEVERITTDEIPATTEDEPIMYGVWTQGGARLLFVLAGEIIEIVE